MNVAQTTPATAITEATQKPIWKLWSSRVL
jgi:hypothetical protein